MQPKAYVGKQISTYSFIWLQNVGVLILKSPLGIWPFMCQWHATFGGILTRLDTPWHALTRFDTLWHAHIHQNPETSKNRTCVTKRVKACQSTHRTPKQRVKACQGVYREWAVFLAILAPSSRVAHRRVSGPTLISIHYEALQSNRKMLLSTIYHTNLHRSAKESSMKGKGKDKRVLVTAPVEICGLPIYLIVCVCIHPGSINFPKSPVYLIFKLDE